MSNPLHAAYYADRAVESRVEIVENVCIARDTYRVRLHCPEIAQRITPGQFVMLRIAGSDDPMLGRPLALYDTVFNDTVVDGGQTAIGIDLVYLVMGKMTSRLAKLTPGTQLDMWGPLGNGFEPRAAEHLVMVAGGIGQTPFPALAAEALGLRRYGQPLRQSPPVGRVTLCYGARSQEYLAGLEDFERLGIDIRLATDDGSRGHHGFVTDLLSDILTESTAGVRVVCCGPEPMMERVAEIAAAYSTACEVSLETPMACGIGICFSCVAKVRQSDGEWDYKRTCVEGPVFEAEKIVW